jgi:hypothetical protein
MGSLAVFTRRAIASAGVHPRSVRQESSAALHGVSTDKDVTQPIRALSQSADEHRPGRVPGRCTKERLQHAAKEVDRMTRKLANLESVSLEEALSYLDSAEGDELQAAFELAKDRNLLDGSNEEPDHAEVHHALFLLRRARGLNAPSFDLMRVQLRKLIAA